MRFTLLKSENNITKTIEYVNKKLVKTAVAQVYSGVAKKLDVNFHKFKDILDDIESNECVILGTTIWNERKVVVEPKEDEISRSLKYFSWDEHNQLIYFDYDESKLGNITPFEFIEKINEYLPGFKDVRKIIKYSSSAQIYKDGILLSKANGFHIYFVVNCPERIRDIFAGTGILHKRLFPKFGWIKNSRPNDPATTAISQYERTIFDGSVFSPERIVFENTPILGEGLEKRNQEAELIDGNDFLDISTVKTISKDEEKRYRDAVKSAKEDNYKSEYYRECKAKFDTNIQGKMSGGFYKNNCKFKGLLPKEIVNREWKSATSGVLQAESKVKLADGSMVSVKDILSDQKRYHLVDCFDPAEPDYSKSPIAKIYSDQDSPVIKSFAHGGIIFSLEESVKVDNFELPEYWLSHMYLDYHDKRNEFLHIFGSQIETMSKDGFISRFAGYWNEDADKSMVSWWLNKKEKLTIAGDGFYPGKPVVYEDNGLLLNSYRPSVLRLDLPEPSFLAAEEAARPWLDHIRKLVYRLDDAETIIDWFAYLIQEPAERPMWCPLICSNTKGVGKDTIVDIFASCLSEEYVRRVPIESLSDANFWGDAFYQSKLIVVSECGGAKERYKVNDTLKSAITDTHKSLNRKGKSITNAKIFDGIIMFSNYDNPFKIESGERRFFATKCTWNTADVMKLEKALYFKKLREFYQDENNINGLYYYLLNRDIKSNLKGVARETEVLREIIDNSVSDVERFFADLNKHPCKFWNTEDIGRLFEDNVGKIYEYKRSFDYHIKQMKSTKCTIKIKGKKQRLKTFDNDLNITTSQLREHIDIHWESLNTISDLYPNIDSDIERFSNDCIEIVKESMEAIVQANNISQMVTSEVEEDYFKDWK